MRDLINQQFGTLLALRIVGNKGAYKAWQCLCDCGKTVVVSSNCLTTGNTKSCGCKRYSKPPRPADKEAALYYGAKNRAKHSGLDYDLGMKELTIPTHCPVLGIALKHNTARRLDNSPSIDRIDSSKGYTKDNVRVISWRANKLKNNGTLEELEAVVRYMKLNTRNQF
jgi:hypothetical protein